MSRNDDQRAFWSEQAGPIWVAEAEAMDAVFQPVLEALMRTAALAPGERVLDIGCGSGVSTARAAAAVGAAGAAVGVDISASLLASARARFGGITFLQADAQTEAWASPAFDAAISRFGVMFFDDFAAAFANIARALRPGGRMAFATWGEIAENPYFTLAARVARDVLGPVPKTDPDRPGPFALRDPARIEAARRAAGLPECAVASEDLLLTPPGDAERVAALLCRIGAANMALNHHKPGPEGEAALRAALAEALEEYAGPKGIRIPARINLVTARTA